MSQEKFFTSKKNLTFLFSEQFSRDIYTEHKRNRYCFFILSLWYKSVVNIKNTFFINSREPIPFFYEIYYFATAYQFKFSSFKPPPTIWISLLDPPPICISLLDPPPFESHHLTLHPIYHYQFLYSIQGSVIIDPNFLIWNQIHYPLN